MPTFVAAGGGGGGGGGGPAVVETATLSKVDVLSVPLATLQTTNPISAVLPMFNVVLPIVDHELPLADTDAVTVVPLRTSFTQVGVGCMAVPRKVVSAPDEG